MHNILSVIVNRDYFQLIQQRAEGAPTARSYYKGVFEESLPNFWLCNSQNFGNDSPKTPLYTTVTTDQSK